MANKIQTKRSSVANKAPQATDLEVGELAVNLADHKLYSKDGSNAVVLLADGNKLMPDGTAADQMMKWDDTRKVWIPTSDAVLDASGNLTVTGKITTANGDVIVPNPPAGQKQVITSGAAADETLALLPAAGQTANQFRVGTNDLIVAANGHVGMGAAPSASRRLVVSGDAQIKNGQVVASGAISPATKPQYTFGGQESKTGMYMADDAEIAFSTAGVERVRIDDSGKVGIGTNSPSQNLVVYGETNSYVDIRRKSKSSGDAALQLAGGSGSSTWAMYMPSGTDDLRFYSSSLKRTCFTIDDTGKAGLGTESPLSTLSVMDTAPPEISFRRNAIGTDNGTLGAISFGAKVDGSAYGSGALIVSKGVGAWSTTSQGGNLSFHTTPSGSKALISRMHIDDAGLVGINGLPGTGTGKIGGFASKLQVNGDGWFTSSGNCRVTVHGAAAKSPGFQIKHDGKSSWALFANASDTNLILAYGSTYHHHFQEDGRVGLGGIAGAGAGKIGGGTAKLQVNGAGYFGSGAEGTEIRNRALDFNSPSTSYVRASNAKGTIIIRTGGNTTANDAIFVDSDQTVVINSGAKIPGGGTAKLQVNGATYSHNYFTPSQATIGVLNDTGMSVYSKASTSKKGLFFFSGGTVTRMEISHAGLVGIGGTPGTGAGTIGGGTAKLQVAGNGFFTGTVNSNQVFAYRASGLNSAGNAVITAKCHAGANIAAWGISVLDSSDTVMAGIHTDGSGYFAKTVNANGAVLTSDERLKKDIEDAPYGLEEVKQLRAKHYDWIDGDEGRQLGLIAQEVEALIPHAVHTRDDEDGTKAISILPLMSAIINAVGELSAENDKLKARLDAAGI